MLSKIFSKEKVFRIGNGGEDTEGEMEIEGHVEQVKEEKNENRGIREREKIG